MVMARMPEDRSKTFKNLQQPSKPYTPVGPTDIYMSRWAILDLGVDLCALHGSPDEDGELSQDL
eukprot:7217324-Heterocapsa_arctica.AAC.1